MHTQQTPTAHTPAPSWSGSPTLVERWLAARRELITRFCSVSALIRQGSRGALLRQQLDQFRDQLVDYVSAGHFEVYAELLGKAQSNRARTRGWLGGRYPDIEESTQGALAFDEACAQAGLRDPQRLTARLSALGELMESRFESEDCLIALGRGDKALVA